MHYAAATTLAEEWAHGRGAYGWRVGRPVLVVSRSGLAGRAVPAVSRPRLAARADARRWAAYEIGRAHV